MNAMRTAITILVGFIAWGACLGVARALGGGSIPALIRATRTFVIFWFMVAVTNMWVGVTQAGYAASEELPIFLLIFGIPALVALAVLWQLRRRIRRVP
jgi:hypothetical protein